MHIAFWPFFWQLFGGFLGTHDLGFVLPFSNIEVHKAISSTYTYITDPFGFMSWRCRSDNPSPTAYRLAAQDAGWTGCSWHGWNE